MPLCFAVNHEPRDLRAHPAGRRTHAGTPRGCGGAGGAPRRRGAAAPANGLNHMVTSALAGAVTAAAPRGALEQPTAVATFTWALRGGRLTAAAPSVVPGGATGGRMRICIRAATPRAATVAAPATTCGRLRSGRGGATMAPSRGLAVVHALSFQGMNAAPFQAVRRHDSAVLEDLTPCSDACDALASDDGLAGGGSVCDALASDVGLAVGSVCNAMPWLVMLASPVGAACAKM
eukprot:356655-Chlamydomonas_euryale.AAC.3